MSKSFLSAGEVIHSMLTSDDNVRRIVGKKVYPIVKDTAELPYVCYRRIRTEQRPAKGIAGSRHTTIEVACYAADYRGSVALAEAVREALDGKAYRSDDMRMSGCFLEDAEETWGNDAFWQILTFNIRL